MKHLEKCNFSFPLNYILFEQHLMSMAIRVKLAANPKIWRINDKRKLKRIVLNLKVLIQ